MFIAVLVIFSRAIPVYAQYFELKGNRTHINLPFKMIRNLIIIPLMINNRGPFNFILDTGVGLMVITDPCLLDSLDITSKYLLKLGGPDEGADFDAYATSPLNIEIPGMKSVDVGAAVLNQDHFGLSNYAGIPVHGLLGFDFFNRLIVKINFNDSMLTVYKPGSFRPSRHFKKIALDIVHNKPYISATIGFCDHSQRTCRLIVDLGAGHPLSLEPNKGDVWPVAASITASLGMGLTGPIHGEISRVSHLVLGEYQLNDIVSSFPNRQSNPFTYEPRDGNLGMEVLKRFTLIFDYPDSLLWLRPATDLKTAFEHDMSGLDYYSDGEGLSHVFISHVDAGTAGDEAGLKAEDEILSVNFKPVTTLTLEELDRMFSSYNGRGFLLEIYRRHTNFRVLMSLKRRI